MLKNWKLPTPEFWNKIITIGLTVSALAVLCLTVVPTIIVLPLGVTMVLKWILFISTLAAGVGKFATETDLTKLSFSELLKISEVYKIQILPSDTVETIQKKIKDYLDSLKK